MIHLLNDSYKKSKLLQILIFVNLILVACVVLPLVILTYLVLYRWHRRYYKAVINRMCYMLWIHFTFIAQWWSGLRLRLHVEEDTWARMGSEHALIIMNHKYDLDWIATWIVAEKIGTLGGGMCFAKNSLKYVPIIGWIWQFNGSMFLQRNWDQDRVVFQNGLADFDDTLQGYYNMLLLYPEGTRFTQAKLAASNEVIHTRSPHAVPLRHCLLPRSRGFIEVIRNLRGKCHAIYDLTIGFPEHISASNQSQIARFTLNNMLNAQIKTGSLYLRRIDLESLPQTDSELSDWLIDCFRRKDDLFEEYRTTGQFPGPSRILEPPLTGLVIYSLCLFIIWIPIGYWIVHILLLGSLLAKASVLGVFSSMVLVIILSKRVTQTERGSSYGSRPTASTSK